MNNWIALGAEPQNVLRDENGVPREWVLLRVGDNSLTREGKDATLRLTAEDPGENLVDRRGEFFCPSYLLPSRWGLCKKHLQLLR